MMVDIRSETISDYQAITQVCDQAFEREAEGILVSKLRKLDCFDPRLSLVAELDGSIVGHVLLLPIRVISEKAEHLGLSLGPIAVRPDYQKQGIGSQLIRNGHQIARNLGYHFIVLLGHPSYYPRFGYKMAALWGLTNPWHIHNDAFMAIELEEGALNHVCGMVAYPEPFNEAT